MSTDPPRRRHRRPPADAITPDTPIWCPACQEEHPASDFNKESRRYSGLAGICRTAQATARRTPEGRAATAARNRRRWDDPQYRAKSLEWQRQRRERNGANADLRRARLRLQRIVDEWKAQGCIDCGYDDIRAIDPDHLDSGTKDGHVEAGSVVRLRGPHSRGTREVRSSLRSLPPQGHTATAPMCVAISGETAALMAATPRISGSERHNQTRPRLRRLRLARLGSRP